MAKAPGGQFCFSHIACFTELVSSLIAISFSSFDLPSKTLRMCELPHLWAAKNMRALYATQRGCKTNQTEIFWDESHA
jgi:hypothetical protein